MHEHLWCLLSFLFKSILVDFRFYSQKIFINMWKFKLDKLYFIDEIFDRNYWSRFCWKCSQFWIFCKYRIDAEVRIYDKDPSKSQNSLEEVVNKSDYIFISLPTPSNIDGSMNLDYVEESLNDINEIIKSSPIILLRSTMTPGSSKDLQKKYPKLNLVFNPEFLTEEVPN